MKATELDREIGEWVYQYVNRVVDLMDATIPEEYDGFWSDVRSDLVDVQGNLARYLHERDLLSWRKQG